MTPRSPVTYAAVLSATQRQATLSVLFSRDLHACLLPQTVDPLRVHSPAIDSQLPVDPRNSVTRIRSTDPTHLQQQTPVPRFALSRVTTVTVRTARLLQNPACTTFRHPIRPQTTTNFRDRRNSPGAYQFPWVASRMISISKTWSTTTFFRREFSFCNAFNCLAIAGCRPPYF